MTNPDERIYDAEMWAEIISASLPTFANPDEDFDMAHKNITDYIAVIIDTVRKAQNHGR